MQEELTFIQYQLWAVLALFAVLVISNVVCNIVKKREGKTDSDEFPELWEKGKLEDLIVRSTDYLRAYPNNVNALYYGAKALTVKKNITKQDNELDIYLT